MRKSQLVKNTLGEHTFEYYIKAKEVEWDEYRTQVHKWEDPKLPIKVLSYRGGVQNE